MYKVRIHERFQIPCISKMTGITPEKLLRDFIENTRILDHYILEVEGERPNFKESHIEPDIHNECERYRKFCNACGEYDWPNGNKPRVASRTYVKGSLN